MSWGLHKNFYVPVDSPGNIQQLVWDRLELEKTRYGIDTHRSIAIEAIKEAVRTCAIPRGSLLEVSANGHWYSQFPSEKGLSYDSPFSFQINIIEKRLVETV